LVKVLVMAMKDIIEVRMMAFIKVMMIEAKVMNFMTVMVMDIIELMV